MFTHDHEPRLFFELPALPGEVGPATAVVERAPFEETAALPRLVFPALVEEPAASTETFEGWTRAELYERAKAVGLPGRSRMCKARLRQALIDHERS